MTSRRASTVWALLAGLLISPASAAPLGLSAPDLGSAFDGLSAPGVSPAYFEDGGWLIFSVPVVGDVLWACPPLANSDPECISVILPIRGAGSAIERWFIDPESGAAWFKISVPPAGDFLLACYEPTVSPHCNLVPIEDRPPSAALSRLDAQPVGQSSGKGGGLLPIPGGAAEPSLTPIDPPGLPCVDGGAADCNSPMFWMTAALPVPGPVNLYVCGGLREEPRCTLAIRGLDLVEAEDFGVQKLSAGPKRGGATAVVIGAVVSGSIADRAGLREGDVVTSAAGFELLFPAHLRGLLLQVPVGNSIRLEVEGKGLVKLTRKARE